MGEGLAMDGLTADVHTVTVAFTDVVDSTQGSRQLGAAAWTDLIRWHDDTIGVATERHGGRVVKRLGDGAMLAFGDPREGLRATDQIRNSIGECPHWPGLPIRIGVHTGPVVALGDDLIGPGAGKASRITDLALPGQVLVSAETRRLADETAWFGPSATVEIRGLDGRHELFPMLALHRPVPTG